MENKDNQINMPPEEIKDATQADVSSEKKTTAEHKEKKGKKTKVSEDELSALRTKAAKLDELQDTFVRRVADFENAKKRLGREKEDFAKFANERIIAAFLPVLDNLDRALLHGSNTETVEGVLSGVELVKKQIMDVLQANGLEKIESVGKPFDPHFHEALGTVISEEHPEDTVVEEIQIGYMLKDKLLRPSWVRVSHTPQTTSDPNTESPDVSSESSDN